MKDYRGMIAALYDEIDRCKDKRLLYGRRLLLAWVEANVTGVTRDLKAEVLERARVEVLIDADRDIDYGAEGQRVQELLLTADAKDDAETVEAVERVNEALRELSQVLTGIAAQLGRRYKEEDYVRLYEQEERRYLSSSGAAKARRTFDEWKEEVCYGSPSMDEIAWYRVEKVLHMFEKGVFDAQVEHVHGRKKYPEELDFDQLEDDHPMKKMAVRHYAELRKLVDWVDGELVVNKGRIGRYFYLNRHVDNAHKLRTHFLAYMYKVAMVQQLRRELLAAQAQAASLQALNRFAPAKNLKVLLAQPWFVQHRAGTQFDEAWTVGFVDALMRSEHGVYIAAEWSKERRRDRLRGCVVGLLRRGGVIKGSMDSIARDAAVCRNYRTFSKYMGQGDEEPYAEWVLGYVRR